MDGISHWIFPSQTTKLAVQKLRPFFYSHSFCRPLTSLQNNMAVGKVVALLSLILSALADHPHKGDGGHNGKRQVLADREVRGCYEQGWVPACQGKTTPDPHQCHHRPGI